MYNLQRIAMYNDYVKTYNLSSNGRINDKSDIEAKMGGNLKYIHKLVFHDINLTKSHFKSGVLTCSHNMKWSTIEGIHKHFFVVLKLLKFMRFRDMSP